MNSNKQDQKVALITGANKSIGFEVARQLGATHRMSVLIGSRDEERGYEAAAKLKMIGVDAHAIQLDVHDEQGINRAAKWIQEEFGRLDVLVNNAGVFLDTLPPSQLDIATFKSTFETNVFGAFLVLREMLPVLRLSVSGRVVNVSSGLGSLTQISDPGYEYSAFKCLAYNSSKAALNMMTVLFAAELKSMGIKVNSADPGYTATDLNNHSGTRTVEQAARAIVRLSTLPDDGPTGGFFDENGELPW